MEYRDSPERTVPISLMSSGGLVFAENARLKTVLSCISSYINYWYAAEFVMKPLEEALKIVQETKYRTTIHSD